MWSRRVTATLMSNGVNTAARLEGIAKASAIYPSDDAYRQVRAKLGLAHASLTRLMADPGLSAGARTLAEATSQAKPTAPE